MSIKQSSQGWTKIIGILLVGFFLMPAVSFADSAKAETLPVNGLRFFENHIRPLLVRHCLECHSEKKQEGEIRLDAWEYLKGNEESDPLVIKGDPENSRLFEVILYHDDDTQMPPKGKIPDKSIVSLRKWIEIGAPWPEKEILQPMTQESMIKDLQESHWAYQPVKEVKVPNDPEDKWSHTEIDRFIHQQMKKEGITPSPDADKRTLLRRVTLDLTGLPPTWEELQEFENDHSENAFEKVVDRLLASPDYGVRWGRHWLDVARYADTKGYVFTDEIRYPYSYTYRDYVVDAMNKDLPYNQFILEQMAADQLGLPENSESLAALGFLTVGNRFRKNIHDQIDDRIDVVSRGLMGLTATCARCHDHKYDPIPTADYYSIYGIFNSSYEPGELPLIGEVQETEEYKEYLAGIEKRQKDIENFRREGHQKILTELRVSAGDYLQFLLKENGYDPKEMKLGIAETNLRRPAIQFWKQYLKTDAGENHPLFRPWHLLLKIPKENFAKESPAVLENLIKEEPGKINPLILVKMSEKPLTNMYEVARLYGNLFRETNQKVLAQANPPAKEEGKESGKESKEKAPKKSGVELAELAMKVSFPEPAEEAIRQVLYVQKTPLNFPFEESAKYFDRAMNNRIQDFNRGIEAWKLESRGTPPRAMVMFDKDKPVNQKVFLRGNPSSHGAVAPRQNYAIVTYGERTPYRKGSGRLELAQSIASVENPLTVRVMVNRVWLHHFDQGIVSSADDFGIRTDKPIHADLLDYLSRDFTENGWSRKKLHKKILLSRVYQQASQDRPEMREKDPENEYFWKMNLRRMGYEALRDSLLAVSGRLDPTLGGKPIDFGQHPLSPRRTIYGFVNRNNLPTIMSSFDFANPDASTSERALTIVPQQALFVMNSPFTIEMAKSLVKKLPLSANTPPEDVIRQLYRNVLLREPSEDELALGLEFVKNESVSSIMDDKKDSKEKNKLSNWERLTQALLLTNEFSHID